MTRRDEIAAILFFLLGMYVAWEGFALSLGTPHKPGPGFQPIVLGAAFMGLALVYLAMAIPARRTAGAPWPFRLWRRPLLGAVAILLPLTYTIGTPLTAIIMLAGIYYGAMYGGSTTSILLNIPGEAASVVTCIDGYQMAKQGRAGAALTIAAIGSFVAGTAGVVGLTFLAYPLSSFALKFGPPEYFALTLLGLFLATFLSSGFIVKGLLMVATGLWLGCVGIDPVSGKFRFAYGIMQLQDGLDFVTMAMGLFGVTEIFLNLETKLTAELVTTRIGRIWPTAKDWAASKWAVLRGSTIGFFVGLLPGGGALVGSLLSYTVEKKIARNPERFGQGAIEGVAGPESANNGAASASFIPLLTLGIPGNPSIAMIFAALLIQGVQPGPFLVAEHPDVFWGVIASMYIGNVMLLILNLPLVGLWVQVLKVPYSILAPIVVLICAIGVYSIKNDPAEILIMLIFGLIGYILRKLQFDTGPMLLAFILGPMIERSLRQSLILSGGSFAIFAQRPISAMLLGVVAGLIVLQIVLATRRRERKA